MTENQIKQNETCLNKNLLTYQQAVLRLAAPISAHEPAGDMIDRGKSNARNFQAMTEKHLGADRLLPFCVHAIEHQHILFF